MNKKDAILVQWLKPDGAFVYQDEPICEIESDKAIVQLPAPSSGLLRQLVKAGATIEVGDKVARIDLEE